jgi:hypothetical protein
VVDLAALQMMLGVLTGWLDRREREHIAYLIEQNQLLLYPAVPMTAPRAVIGGPIVESAVALGAVRPGSSAFPSPKSSSLTVPSRWTLMFPGLRSR